MFKYRWLIFTILTLLNALFIYKFKDETFNIAVTTKVEENFMFIGIIFIISIILIYFLSRFINKLVKNIALSEHIFLIIWYSITCIYLMINSKDEYFIPGIFYGKDLNYISVDQNYDKILNFNLKCYWGFVLAYHVYSSFNENFMYTKDFILLTIHHHVTVFLIIYCILFRQFIVGLNISFLHDFSDIFWNLTKFCHFKKYHKFVQFLFLFFFLISWNVCRNYLFLIKVYPYIFYKYFVKLDSITNFKTFNIHNFAFLILTILIFLNLFWTFKIFRLIIKKFRK